MFCIRCGATLPEEAAFCGKCGKPTDNSPQNAMPRPSDPEDSLLKLPSENCAPIPEQPTVNPVVCPPLRSVAADFNLIETRLIASCALILLAALGIWLWGRYTTFEPDKLSDYSSRSGRIESAQEYLAKGAVSSGHLDIRIVGSPVILRVPADGYFDYFQRANFFKEVAIGQTVVLSALKSEWEAPKMVGVDQVVFVRGVRVESKVYASVQDHIQWQVNNNRWLLLFPLVSLLGFVIIVPGLCFGGTKQVLGSENQNYRPLSFTGRGSDVFSRNGIVAFLCGVSVIGIPAATVFIYRWLAKRTYIGSGQNLAFVGAIGTIYWITFLSCLLQITQSVLPLDSFYALFAAPWLRSTVVALTVLFFSALQCWIGFLTLRYCVTNLCLPDGEKFEANVPRLKYIGINLIGLLSLFTVVGYAWWAVWVMKWLARRISAPNVSFRFSGTGFQCLWRVTAALVASAPLVTIPWTYAWLVRWFVSSVEINSTEIEKETLSASS